ncbi:prepilin peptidase [Gimibacter soli]|uniref:A24 family peptidase n=1 Tax=Gimibacter soli TaxID=3024400 RepID=A0AAF0BLQ3_9PROT|nr:A24 family peptidase [Gimibacter soli]WCL53730.1 A24 family peptidase [Gimibacter soli]
MEPRASLADIHWPAFAAGLVIIGGACAYMMPDLPRLAASLVLLTALLYLALYDIRHMRLPNAVTFPLIALGLLHAGLNQYDNPFADSLIGAAAGYGILWGISAAYRALRGRDGLGLGDAKLVAAAGAWLGWQSLPFLLLFAAGGQLLALLIPPLIGKRFDSSAAIPFGPAITLSFWALWLVR